MRHRIDHRALRRQARTAMLLAFAITVAVPACSFSRKVPDMRYYLLRVPGEPKVQLDAPISVGVVSGDQPYSTERMAYRMSPYRIDYYNYHRWAGNPRVIVATATRDYLARAATDNGATPYELRAHIRRLEEVDSPGAWDGALSLDVVVSRGGTMLVERSFDEIEPAESRAPEAVVAALSRALGRVLDATLEAVDRSVATPSTPAADVQLDGRRRSDRVSRAAKAAATPSPVTTTVPRL